MKLTEKQKNCPYCHEQDSEHYGKVILDDASLGTALVHLEDGWHLCSWDYDVETTTDKPIAACPMCIRPLNEEEE